MKIDLVFVIDGSDSIGANNWNAVLSFTVGIATGFFSLGHDVLVAIVVYSTDASVIFTLSEGNDLDTVSSNILSIEYTGGQTGTSVGLQVAIDEVFLNQPNNRQDARDVLVLITAGADATDNAQQILQANRAKTNSIFIVSVGITDAIDVATLQEISSTTSAFQVDTFTSLSAEEENIRNFIVDNLMEMPSITGVYNV